MLIVFFISILCLLLTAVEARGKYRHGMLLGFLLVTFLYCIHYDYGTDYMTYYVEFNRVVRSKLSFMDVFDLDNWRNGEYGWGLLQWIFAHLGSNGFFAMVALNSIVENLIIYKVIRKYLDRTYWSFAVFVYLFSSSFYLLGFSMMRQWLAMCLFVFAIDLMMERKILWSVVVVYLASTIHHTATILLPFVFVPFMPLRFSRYYGLAMLCLFAILMLVGDALNSTLGILMIQSDTIEDYITNYESFDANKSFGIGFCLNAIPFVLSIYYLIKVDDSKYKLLILLSCIGTMIVPFSQNLAMVKRMSLYFTLFSVLTIPIVYNIISNKTLRYILIAVFVLMQIVGYYGFLNDPSYIDYYRDFKTIFPQL